MQTGIKALLMFSEIVALFFGALFLVNALSLGATLSYLYEMIDAILKQYSQYMSNVTLPSSLPSPTYMYPLGLVLTMLGMGGLIATDYKENGLIYAGLVTIAGTLTDFVMIGLAFITFPQEIYNALIQFNVNVSLTQIELTGYAYIRNTLFFSILSIVLIIVGFVIKNHYKTKEEELKKEKEREEKLNEQAQFIDLLLKINEASNQSQTEQNPQNNTSQNTNQNNQSNLKQNQPNTPPNNTNTEKPDENPFRPI